MAVPPSKQDWHTGPTQRLPRRDVHAVSGRAPQRPRSRRRTCGIAFLITLGIGLLLIGGSAWWAWSRYQDTVVSVQANLDNPQLNAAVTQEPDNAVARPTPDMINQPFNVLLIGVDLRPDDDSARSDTMIVVHVDPQNKWASMLSVPRDNCARIVGIDGHGECHKINAAYAEGYKLTPDDPSIGGMRVTRDTIEEYMGLDAYGQQIDYVMQVNFDGFKQIIDTMGGITIDVAEPLFDSTYPTDDGDYGYIRLFIPPGVQHMDGVTALRYARSRHVNADYGRAARQQQVIRAILDALRNQGLLDQLDRLNQLADQLHATFRTDLPVGDPGALKGLAQLASGISGNGRISNFTLGPFDSWTGNVNTPIWDPAEVQARVAEWLTGPGSTQPQPTQGGGIATALKIEVMNGVQLRGLAGDVSDHLSSAGYATADPSTAGDFYPETLLVDFGAHTAERRQLATLLGIKPTNIIDAAQAPELPADPTTDMLLIVGGDYKEAWRTSR